MFTYIIEEFELNIQQKNCICTQSFSAPMSFKLYAFLLLWLLCLWSQCKWTLYRLSDSEVVCSHIKRAVNSCAWYKFANFYVHFWWHSLLLFMFGFWILRFIKHTCFNTFTCIKELRAFYKVMFAKSLCKVINIIALSF